MNRATRSFILGFIILIASIIGLSEFHNIIDKSFGDYVVGFIVLIIGITGFKRMFKEANKD